MNEEKEIHCSINNPTHAQLIEHFNYQVFKRSPYTLSQLSFFFSFPPFFESTFITLHMKS